MKKRKKATAKKQTRRKRSAVVEVLAWEDDPMSGQSPIRVAAPDPDGKPLQYRFSGTAPAARVYKQGSKEFRYWVAVEGLRRGADYWSALLPAGTTWQIGPRLAVLLDAGEDLNAYYDRSSLSFFHAKADSKTLYSGESPDALCHELGHAILDAIRPELWDTMSDEVAAFHEAFGDISAILCALQLASVRSDILTVTEGNLYQTTRLSRLAEQLSWGIRLRRPDLVDPDCLRNAVNAFFYSSPMTLPPSGPASQLSSEPHNFSRVFSGGFFEAMSGMLKARSAKPKQQDLLQVSRDAGQLIVEAIRNASIVPDYFSQVAAELIEADSNLFDGFYADALRSAFVRRGILSLQAGVAVKSPQRRSAIYDAQARPAVGSLSLAGEDFGLGERALIVQAAAATRRFSVASASIDLGALQPAESERSARAFVEYLFRRGRVNMKEHGESQTRIAHRHVVRKTHELTRRDDSLTLVRNFFDCGLD